MNPDLLTPAEARNENRFLGKVLVLWLMGFLGFIIGWSVASACDYEQIKSEVIKITLWGI